MKKIILFILLSISSISFSQKLKFDKLFIENENKWIALQTDSVNVYSFGFVYVDPEAGLTFDFSGTFELDSTDKIIKKDNVTEKFIKYRVEPINEAVAELPKSFYTDLEIKETPDWLKFYTIDENSTSQLYNRGFMLNAWQKCNLALEPLTKAYELDPNSFDVIMELTYSYNCLQNPKEALKYVEKAIQMNPKDPYANKEYLYAQIHSDLLDEAIKTYEYGITNIDNNIYQGENAYNILGEYYRRNDLKNFDKWLKKTNLLEDIDYGARAKDLQDLMNNN